MTLATSLLIIRANAALESSKQEHIAERIILFPDLVKRLQECESTRITSANMRHELMALSKQLTNTLAEINGFTQNANIGAALITKIRKEVQLMTSKLIEIQVHTQHQE